MGVFREILEKINRDISGAHCKKDDLYTDMPPGDLLTGQLLFGELDVVCVGHALKKKEKKRHQSVWWLLR